MQNQFRTLRSEPARIVIPKPREVKMYLSEHPELGRILPEICTKVRQSLGPRAELSLEMYRDPEIDDQYLNLYVRQERYGSKLLDRINMVSSLFDNRLEEISGYLLITTDFRRPRRNHVI